MFWYIMRLFGRKRLVQATVVCISTHAEYTRSAIKHFTRVRLIPRLAGNFGANPHITRDLPPVERSPRSPG